jgi:hypothetical protein
MRNRGATLEGEVRHQHQSDAAFRDIRDRRRGRDHEPDHRREPRRRPLMEAVMDDTIVTVRFTDLGQARRALRMLKLLSSEGQLRVRAAAALVERSAQGRSAARRDPRKRSPESASPESRS